MLVIELEPGEYKIDKIDTNLFDTMCNCYEGYRLRFNNTNFKVENKIARITPYALTTLTYTDKPNNNKTFLSRTNNKFKYNIRWYLENLLLKKDYDKNWKIMQLYLFRENKGFNTCKFSYNFLTNILVKKLQGIMV